jgi:hypothetical protein
MMALILLTQVAFPLAPLAWLAFLPEGSHAGLVLKVFGIGAFLFE